ncbi:hypothetical protein AAG906_003514 [Vitis piasezkii]
MSASVSLQSRFNSDRISYLLSSLLYNYLELDISLIASGSIDTFDLGSTSWIRVEGRLIRISDHLSQKIDGQQTQEVPPQNEIERYTGIGCPRLHLRLYSTIMRAHGLDEAQMIMLFPMSLSGATQQWFASLDVSRYRTWDDLAPRDLYGIEEGIAKGLWSESSPSDSKGKKPLGGQRSGDVGVIGSVGLRPPRRYQTVGQTSKLYYPPSPRVQYRPRVLSRSYDQAYMPSALALPYHATTISAVSSWFMMDLHYAYHQGSGHETNRCTALKHPSITTNPLPAHTTHAVPPSTDNMHSIDFVELDDHIHMLS